MPENATSSQAVSAKVFDLECFKRSLDIFLRPALFSINAFAVLIAFFSSGILLVPILAALSLYSADYSLGTFGTIYIATPASLLFIYFAFSRFTLWFFAISLCCTLVYLIAFSLVLEPDLYLNAGDTPSSTLEELAIILVFLLYAFLIIYYLWKRTSLLKSASLFPGAIERASLHFSWFSRYGIFSRRSVLLNLTKLFSKWVGVYLAVLAISLPLAVLGLPLWFIVPAVLYFYGAPRFWSYYDTFRRQAALSANALYAADRRDPILFLRSFKADRLQVPREFPYSRWLLGSGSELISLERVLVDVAFTFGPVGAASNPKSNIPPLGAAREFLLPNNWREYVADRISLSHDVICIIGETPSLSWELRTAYAYGNFEKFIFVFPPRWSIHPDNESFYDFFCQVTGFPKSHSGLPVVLFYQKDGTPTLITAREVGQRDYALAMRLALASRRD